MIEGHFIINPIAHPTILLTEPPTKPLWPRATRSAGEAAPGVESRPSSGAPGGLHERLAYGCLGEDPVPGD